MQNLINDTLAKLKKISFKKIDNKNSSLSTSDIDTLRSVIKSESDKLSLKSNFTKKEVNTVLLSSLLERAKELKIMSLLSERKSKKNQNQQFLMNIANIHEELAIELA